MAYIKETGEKALVIEKPKPSNEDILCKKTKHPTPNMVE